MRRETISHGGETYVWKCPFADGDYYENRKGYLLTNADGTIRFASAFALESSRRKHESQQQTS